MNFRFLVASLCTAAVLHSDLLEDSGDSPSTIATTPSLSVAFALVLALALVHAPAPALALALALALAFTSVLVSAEATATAERWAAQKNKEDCFMAEEKRKKNSIA